MELKQFLKIFNDKNYSDLVKMKHKYGQPLLEEYLGEIRESFYSELGLLDFNGNRIVYIPEKIKIESDSFKILYKQESMSDEYSNKAMVDETAATFDIEDIDYSLQSVRDIFAGLAPKDKMEERIAGMKKGIDFINDKSNVINEENLYALYKLSIWDSLDEHDFLADGELYRNDVVIIHDGFNQIHRGLDYDKLPKYMNDLIKYINNDDKNELVKAAIIHFYISYLHPYFDGNGRMSRLVQMWHLVQQGYTGVMHVSLSKFIDKTRKQYYKSFKLVEENLSISNVINVNPFITYMNDMVYKKLPEEFPYAKTTEDFKTILKEGQVTEKEQALWNFVISNYGMEEFSTKQLERDFGNAAYATIRSFVIKFEEKGLLTKKVFKNRNRYSVRV